MDFQVRITVPETTGPEPDPSLWSTVPNLEYFPSEDFCMPLVHLSDFGSIVMWYDQGRPLAQFSTIWFSVILEDRTMDLNDMWLRVIGPSGTPFSVSCREGQFRADCAFLPTEPGDYILSGSLGELYILDSPESILVERPEQDLHQNTSLTRGTSTRHLVAKLIVEKPWGLCIIPENKQIMITDQDTSAILVCDFDGLVLSRIGEKEKLAQPTGICYDTINRRILVVDQSNNRVVSYSPQGEFIKAFGDRGSEEGKFLQPWGIATSPDGSKILVADSGNHRVQMFDKDFKFIGEYRGTKPSSVKQHLKDPRGVIFSNDGSVFYVTDFTDNRVLRARTDLSSSYVLMEGFCGPSGIHVSKTGNVIVCDSNHNCLKVLDGEFGCVKNEIVQLGSSYLNIPLNITSFGRNSLAILAANGRVFIV